MFIILWWGCTITCRLCLVRNFENAGEIFAFVSFSIVFGLFTAVAFYHLHNCLGLELIIDEFSVRFVDDDGDITELIAMWNMTNVLLRRTANCLEGSILALQTSVPPAVLLTAMHLLGHKSLTCGSCVQSIFGMLPPVVLALYTLFRTAAVTEKCIHVPAFVNSWITDGSAMEQEHHHFVQYIFNSSAGFYIKGLRLTTFMVVKVTYFLGMLGFSLVVRIGLETMDQE